MNDKRILIVDDEKDICKFLYRTILNAHPDCMVKTAGDGATALDHLHGQEIDLALIDYNMPLINGLQLAKTVRDISPDTNIVLMSGKGNSIFDDEQNSLSDLDGFISKPFRISQVLNIIEHVLGHTTTKI